MVQSKEDIVLFIMEAPFFRGASREAVARLVSQSEIVEVSEGEMIIEENQHEMTCYVVLSGSFSVSVMDKERKEKQNVGFLEPQSIVGEMSILSGLPRRADVTCVKDSSVMLIQKEGLIHFLGSAPEVKERIDEEYRSRIVSGAMRRLEVFREISDDLLEELTLRITLLSFEKNEEIFGQGDVAESFFLILDGFVRMSRSLEGDESAFFDSRFDMAAARSLELSTSEAGEYIMSYLGPGAYFGDMALIGNRARSARAMTTTGCELLEIHKNDFDYILEKNPGVKEKLRAIGEKRVKAGETMRNSASQELLRFMEKSEVLEGEDILLIDLNHCIRCLNCIETCAQLHDGISRLTHNGIRFRNILIPTSCRRCREPVCMIGCPTGAIQRDKRGEVFHTDECIGCGNCARRCPFDNISIMKFDRRERSRGYLNQLGWRMRNTLKADAGRGEAPRKKFLKQKAVKCDLCVEYGRVGCQHNCPTGSILSVKPSEYFAHLAESSK